MFKRKRRKTFFYILFLAISFFSLNRFIISFSRIWMYTYATLAYPLLLSQKYIVTPVKKLFEKRKTEQELQELVFKLYKEKEDIISENIYLQAQVSFFDQIKELLDFKKRYNNCDNNNCDNDILENNHNFQLCHIILKHINHESHFIFIDKGSSCGVCKDMVLVYKNFLLGKVVQVYPFYSKVLLITDKSCKVAAYCAKTKANGIHQGLNSQNETLLTRISHFEKVLPGDIVLSSGYGLVFPQGFALGKIMDVESGELYHTIKLDPLFDIKNIDYCFLIKKGKY